MSAATDLLTEVKALAREADRTVKAFEKDVNTVGAYTDLAHLNIAKIHLNEFLGKLSQYRAAAANEPDDAEDQDEELAEATAEPQEPSAEPESTPAPEPAPEPAAATAEASTEASTEAAAEPAPVDDPAADLIAPKDESEQQ